MSEGSCRPCAWTMLFMLVTGEMDTLAGAGTARCPSPVLQAVAAVSALIPSSMSMWSSDRRLELMAQTTRLGKWRPKQVSSAALAKRTCGSSR